MAANPRRRRSLEGRVALLTGAAGGIGAATARRLVAEGVTVALVDNDAQGVQRPADPLAARVSRVPVG